VIYLNWCVELTLEKAVNFISVILNLYGTYCMAKGLLSLHPREILNNHPSYTSIVHSNDEITAIISNRLETAKGIIYIVFAVIVQIVLLFLNDTQKSAMVSTAVSFYIILCIVFLYKLDNYVTNGYKRHKVDEVNKYFIREKINQIPEKVNGTFNSTEEIRRYASCYFGLNQNKGEEFQDFMNRISDFVGAKHLY
jgi:hypothetical protein